MSTTMAPIDPRRQGRVALPSIRTQLPEFFEDKGNDLSDLPPIPIIAPNSPISSGLLLPPVNRSEGEQYALRPAVFSKLDQRRLGTEIHTGYTPSGASSGGDGRLEERVVAPPHTEERIGVRVATGEDDDVSTARGSDSIVRIRTQVVRFATPVVSLCGSSEPTQVTSDSDSSPAFSAEIISAARILCELRRGLVKEGDNYYNSDADEDGDESPVEEYPGLKRSRTGRSKSQGTFGGMLEQTYDAVEKRMVVQGRGDEASKLGARPSPTKWVRCDGENTLPAVFENDELLGAKAKPLANSTNTKGITAVAIHEDNLSLTLMNELPFAGYSEFNTFELV
ncbi:hypothetical protein EYR40_009107 [Pleurotus pulmonarius]|nr:hypothetical protein EYR40_009107 [Pleurotus pulmonarius]